MLGRQPQASTGSLRTTLEGGLTHPGRSAITTDSEESAAMLAGVPEAIVEWASLFDGKVGWVGVAVPFVLCGLVFIPRSAICILAGLMLGLYAFPLAVVATTAGSLLGFVISRYFFRTWFVQMLERRPQLKRIADAIDAEGWRLLFLLRLASPVPGPVANYAFGLSSIRIPPYVVATALGITPQVFAFVYLGAVARVALDAQSVTSVLLAFHVVGVALLLLAITMLAHRVRRSVSGRIGDVRASSPHRRPAT
jgi:uncharacterized membrane protein YdjX (TVP38/TMEM64 family)